MPRRHVQMMYGELGPGGTDSYVVPTGTKLLLSSMLLSAVTVGVAVVFEVRLNPAGGVPAIITGAINNDGDNPNPYPMTEPWAVLLSNDVLEVANVTPFGGPNLNYSFGGILFDPP